MAAPSLSRRILGKGFALATVIWAVWFLSRSIGAGGWKAVGERLSEARPGWMALAVLTTLCVYVVWTLRWRLLLAPVVRVPWWPAQKALMASIFINTVVPFARSMGGLVRAGYLGRARNIGMAKIYGPTLIDQIGYSTVSVGLGALCVPFALWGSGSGRGRTGVGLIVAALVTAAALLILRGRRTAILEWVRRRVPGAAQSVETAVEAAKAVLFRPATWPLMAGGGAAVWLLNVTTFWIAGRAIGAGFGFGAAAAAWSLGSMAGVASGTPGGVGTTESAAILPLVGSGIPAPAALAAVLLARLIQYTTAILIGGACLLAGPGSAARLADLTAETDAADAAEPIPDLRSGS